MGLGRRDFLKLLGTAFLAVVSQPVSNAITILNDTYVNWKLGIAFQKPSGWYFNDIKEMGEILNGEILDLIDVQLAKKIITETELPFVSMSQTPLSLDDLVFTPGVNVYLDICSAPRQLDSNAKQGTLFKRRSAACVKDEISAPSSRQR